MLIPPSAWRAFVMQIRFDLSVQGNCSLHFPADKSKSRIEITACRRPIAFILNHMDKYSGCFFPYSTDGWKLHGSFLMATGKRPQCQNRTDRQSNNGDTWMVVAVKSG